MKELINYTPGIYIVQRNRHGKRCSLIAKLMELHDLHIPTLAAIHSREDQALKLLNKLIETSREKGYFPSIQNIFETVAFAVAKGEQSIDDKAAEDFVKSLDHL